MPLGNVAMNDSDVVIDTHANTHTHTHANTENKIQNDFVI
jgi:hypothetical protein